MTRQASLGFVLPSSKKPRNNDGSSDEEDDDDDDSHLFEPIESKTTPAAADSLADQLAQQKSSDQLRPPSDGVNRTDPSQKQERAVQDEIVEARRREPSNEQV